MASNSTIPERIGIYGTGRVASALLRGVKEAGWKVEQLIGRDPGKLEALKEQYRISRTDLPEEADPELDLLLIAVSDDALEEAFERLPPIKGVLAHCSGVRPLSVLAGNGKGQAVLYPLQSFSSEEKADWKEVPICVEASDPESEALLMELARSLSETVKKLSGEERRSLHLAAVFACNFSNHLFGVGKEILDERGIPYELLRSLILHTARKGVTHDPSRVQTGPAVRGDRETMEEHLEMLEKDPELQDLYRRISQRIMERAHGTSEL